MKHAILASIAVLLLPLTAGAETAEQKGLRIAKQVEKANEGFKGEKSTSEMVLKNARGDTTKRKMSSIVKERRGDGDQSRIEFLWPADVKGTRMLTWTHKRKDDTQWLYLPAFNRTKRITSRNKSGSFMGSEFSYEDLNSQEPEKFRHKFLADETVDGRKVWKTQRIPKDSRSGYSKQVLWIDQGYMNVVKIDYYDRRGSKLKTATFSEYKKYGKLWRVGKIDVFNHQTRKRSTLTWSKRQLNVSLDSDLFDSDELAE